MRSHKCSVFKQVIEQCEESSIAEKPTLRNQNKCHQAAVSPFQSIKLSNARRKDSGEVAVLEMQRLEAGQAKQ